MKQIRHSTLPKVKTAQHRMGILGRWEYYCPLCREWLPPRRFKKTGKDKSRVVSPCKQCDKRRNQDEIERKARQRAAGNWRRERIMRATPQDPQKGIRAFYVDAEWRTRITGIKHVVDHIVPLKHDLVCGLNVVANLQVLTNDENVKKRNSFTPYYETPDGHKRLIDEDSVYVFVPPKQVRPRVRVVKSTTNEQRRDAADRRVRFDYAVEK